MEKEKYVLAYDLLKEGKKVMLTGFHGVPQKVMNSIVADKLGHNDYMSFSELAKTFTDEEKGRDEEIRGEIREFVSNRQLIFIDRPSLNESEFELLVDEGKNLGVTDVVVDDHDYLELEKHPNVQSLVSTIQEKHGINIHY